MPKDQSKRGLPPITHDRATVLILGTLPGDESLRRQQYYGHPRNHFWPLIAALANEDTPTAYRQRVALLKRCRFALWDVLHSAERAGSLDSAIRDGQPNAFEEFFARFPNIGTVAFNGQKARALFRTHVASDAEMSGRGLRLIGLPSSSPTYVRPFEEKLIAWRAAFAPDQNFLAR